MSNFSTRKQEWPRVRIADIAEVFDGPHATPKTVDEGPVFLGIGALQDGSINLDETRHVTPQDYLRWTRRVVPKANDFVFSYETRLGAAALIPEGLDCCLGRRMGLARLDEDKVDPRFFLYQYQSPLFQDFLRTKTIQGATVDRISIKDFPQFHFFLPSKDVQKRIASWLDEAFDGTALAISNAKQNLQNAKSLLSSYFDSSLNGRKNWTALPIHMCFKVRSGDFLPAKQMDQTGSVPVYGGNGIAGHHIAPNLDGDNIIIGRVGAKCGNVRHVKGPLWLTDNALYVSELLQPFDKEFLAIRLEAEDLRRTANQTAQPVISYSTIKNTVLSFPLEVQEQRSVVQALSLLSLAVDSLRATIEMKISSLSELRQALLTAAFSGNL